MQCSCGGPTEDRQVVRKKRVVSEYARCESCGRVHVWWSTDVRAYNAPVSQEAKGRISRG
jgi:uncharacterized Zn finger protein